jgi:mannosyltransferase OCH1-like enzyme
MEMTKNVFQIFINDKGDKGKLSEFLEKKVNKTKEIYDGYNHFLYSDSMIRSFLYKFDKETLNSYDMLKPYAYKADLTRYCLLYEYGGWYFDVSLAPEFKLEFNNDVDAFIVKNNYNNNFENCTLYFKPKSIYLMQCIKQINFHVLRKYYGYHVLDITGPGLLKRVYNKENEEHFINYKFGDFVDLSIQQYVCKYENEIFARFKYPQKTGLSYLGAKNTNNYEEMWKANDVYKY